MVNLFPLGNITQEPHDFNRVERQQEEKNPALDNYFSKVQYKLDGINSLFKYPVSMVEVMGLVESALLESRKENPSHKKFRKMILDAHEMIDKMMGEINV